MRNNEISGFRSLKKDLITCLQMTIIFGVIFSLIFHVISDGNLNAEKQLIKEQVLSWRKVAYSYYINKV